MSLESCLKPILLAIDSLSCSAAGLKQAVWLAQKIETPRVLIHAIPDCGQSVH